MVRKPKTMTTHASAPGGFAPAQLDRLLHQACAMAGLDPRDARLLRGHTNAVFRLAHAPVVLKIARNGSSPARVQRTVDFVVWLMDNGFPTTPLHPVHQPLLFDGHAATLWRYFPQSPHPVTAEQLAKPLHALHTLPRPPIVLPDHDNLGAIRRSIDSITCLPPHTLTYLSKRADELEAQLARVDYALPPGVIQGDPQHRNALHTEDGEVVLCDWDTVALGQPEWDLVTVEVHCRRFGYGRAHYSAFADTYGWDITRWPGYPTLAAIRELRMITTNARKVPSAPHTYDEVRRRIDGLQQDPHLRWNIL